MGNLLYIICAIFCLIGITLVSHVKPICNSLCCFHDEMLQDTCVLLTVRLTYLHAMKAWLFMWAGQLYLYNVSREYQVKTLQANTVKVPTIWNMKDIPFLMYRILSLVFSIAAMISRFKIHWVSCCADSNDVYPTSIACKTAKLTKYILCFTDRNSQFLNVSMTMHPSFTFFERQIRSHLTKQTTPIHPPTNHYCNIHVAY